MKCIGLTLAVAVAVAAAQEPKPPSAAPKFRHERSVDAPTSGAHRLAVDVTLLSGGTPFTVTAMDGRSLATGGLADLRLYDAAGGEVPYLVVPPPAGEPSWKDARVLPLAQTEKTSGFEADLGEVLAVDAIRVSGIRAPFLKRLVLEGSGDREHWTLLAGEGTLFDLPAERLQQTTLPFAPGPYRFLRITWNDTHSGRVDAPALVQARRVPQPIAPAPALRAPLVFERRPSEPGISRFRIHLPAARLPIVELALGVGGGHLLRQARVSEARLTGEHVAYGTIGAGTLRRVVRDGVAADALRIPIAPPREAQLELVVDDGDNPPLDLQSVTAVFAELPWIYFEHEAGTLAARYGDAALPAPRYDLEAARPAVTAAQTAEARWGDPRPLTLAADDPPALPMPETGAALQAASFKYSRAVPAGSGLVAVPLDAAALAHSGAVHASFADVRVLDSAGRQVPYLVERRDEPIAIDVRLVRRELPSPIGDTQKGRTSYAVEVPYQRLPGARLVLQTRARVFTRGVTLAMLTPPTEQRRLPALAQLSSSLWQHSNQDAPARGLVFDFPETRSGDVVVIVDEGDNQPLPIEKATLLLRSYAIRFYRPAGQPLRLVYGRDDLSAPRYDLALLAPRVMGSRAEEVHAAPEQPAAASSAAPAIVPPRVFWASLGLAVVVLLGLIARLVRREEGAASA